MTAVAEPTPVGDSYVAVVPARELFVDRSYQRELAEGWVAKRAQAFDRRLFGILDVSDRGEDWAAAGLPGRYAIIDGQQRHGLAVAALGPDTPVAVTVHEGLTVAEEAALMFELDRSRRKLTSWDRWRTRRAAGDQQVAEIEAVAAKHRLRFAAAGAPGAITATGTAERLYRQGGAGLLDVVLGVLRHAWGQDPGAYAAPMLGAVGDLLHFHGSRVDLDVLAAGLRRSRPWDVRATAAGYRTQGIREGTPAQLLVDAIIDRYNRAAPAAGKPRLAYIRP